MHLVLIETSGNQAFIFATNKQRENVGASELTARAGTEFVLKAVRKAGGPDLWSESAAQVRDAIRDRARNPPLEEGGSIEVILAVSGKALLLVQSKELGKQIVAAVTRQALEEAPGLDVRGVVIDKEFNFDQGRIQDAVKKVHEEFQAVRTRLPGPDTRFQRLPIIEPCVTSGLPAAREADMPGTIPKAESGPHSAQSLAKVKARKGWKRRRDAMLKQYKVDATLPDATTELEKIGCDWVAIVHVDGNGLGRVFLNFEKYLGESRHEVAQQNRRYIDQLRRFSLALEECTEKAFCGALATLKWPREAPSRDKRQQPNLKPIVPLVLGGDDLTVICDGRQALRFARQFIVNFEQATKACEDVNQVLQQGVTSCAGVAIIKPHFPFHAGYGLAEQLIERAKKLGKDPKGEDHRSAVDFHMLYDASGPDLDRLRAELTVDEGATRLVARPYLLDPSSADHPGRAWKDLERRIAAVRKKGEDGVHRALPNGMLHELREGLFHGRESAEARLQLVRDRYKELRELLVDNKLFWKDPEHEEKPDLAVTGLLDAVDCAEFWEADA